MLIRCLAYRKVLLGHGVTYIPLALLIRVSMICVTVFELFEIGPSYMLRFSTWCLTYTAMSSWFLAAETSRRVDPGSRLLMSSSSRPQITTFAEVSSSILAKQARAPRYSSLAHKSSPSTTRTVPATSEISGSRSSRRTSLQLGLETREPNIRLRARTTSLGGFC
jgi:hypothetical protein